MRYPLTSRLPAFAIFLIGCLSSLDAWAGPHLKSMPFSRSILNSPWSKVLFFSILAVGIPALVLSRLRGYFKVWRTMSALQKMARRDPNFDWQTLKSRFAGIFTAMHQSFDHPGAFNIAHDATTSFREEQRVLTQYRKSEGLLKKNSLGGITLIEPILLRYSGEKGGEDSTIVIDFKANVETYFTEAQTGEIVQGTPGFREEETVWTFHLHKGSWLLHNIEPVELKPIYIGLTNDVPKGAIV